MENKSLASLDIKSLYTNIPVDKCLNRLEKHLSTNDTQLSCLLTIQKIIKICRLCTSHCYFQHNNVFYKQKFGLPMGSPLSGLLACLYLEFLEAGPFKYIIPKDAQYFRYIDDTLIIYPSKINITKITNRLNDIEPTIQFTHELEFNNSLPFLDISLIKNNNALEFKVHHKPTAKNDHIHYYSHHDTHTKRGIIIGFHLRALRICTPKHLDDEFTHIMNTFRNLQYPTSFIQHAKAKALRIHTRNQVQNPTQSNSPHRYIILPNNHTNSNISKNLKNLGIKTVSLASKTIHNILNKNSRQHVKSEAGVYMIPCADCHKKYIGETSRNLKKRLYEHKRNIKFGDSNNCLFQHISKTQHMFNFRNASMIAYIHNKRLRQIFEASAISNIPNINSRSGFFNISAHLGKTIINSYKPNRQDNT